MFTYKPASSANIHGDFEPTFATINQSLPAIATIGATSAKLGRL